MGNILPVTSGWVKSGTSIVDYRELFRQCVYKRLVPYYDTMIYSSLLVLESSLHRYSSINPLDLLVLFAISKTRRPVQNREGNGSRGKWRGT
jgi:hypothetical protein